MKLPSKRQLILAMLASLLGGVALAAYELNSLHRGLNVGHEIGAAVAKVLGGTVTQETVTVYVSLCFGLIPVERLDNPYLVIAVGDLILGTLITAFAIVVVYTLRGAFSRNTPMDKPDGESRNA